MQIRNSVLHVIRCAPIALLALGGMSCGLDKQTAPALAGPSEFGTSVTLSASPEVLLQDGQSQSTITATVRNENGAPKANETIRWNATASTPLAEPVRISETTTVTDGNGVTRITLTSPPRPTEAPPTPDTIMVVATPAADSGNGVFGRSVTVRLLPPPGTPPRNDVPVAAFSMEPGVGIIGEEVRFNAQATRDGGEPCLNRCKYLWDFGNNKTATGMIVTHRFVLEASYDVTLTVTDEHGAVDVLQQTFDVWGSAGALGMFGVNPESPTHGNAATFDARFATVPAGTVITEYAWNFGDGSAVVETKEPTVDHTFAEAGRYVVKLTITTRTGDVETPGDSWIRLVIVQ